MRFKLSLWERYFPDGVGSIAYAKIGRAIRKHGMTVEIVIRETEPDEQFLEFMRILKALG